ncbi:hypothetical protein DFH07DRAFT_731410 [Mycena maculata]|uniref:Uncharacterized protein n=1 Tax=Mycena maculata TaxID=230809 RepID=A0AAD7K435_9AGAR|nr:hypothetical protein DFH07DRAFT_731410 [Mycena maculata]
MPRQIIADQPAVEAAETQCQVESGNQVISCFPTADVVIPQHQWAFFIWNSNNPDFVQTDLVDIYLFHGDSLEQALFIPSHINPSGQAGSVSAQVNDSWWGSRGVNWDGTNISYPFYWLIARAGESLDDGTLQPQTTFSAVQTTFADSVLAAMASSSASASSAAAAASRTRSSLTTVVTTINGSATTIPPTGNIQSSAGSSPFPHWAIIVLVLGIVAVLAICGCMWFGIYYLRERDRDREGRHQVRSSSPSIVQVEADAAAPVAAGAAALGRDTSVTTSQGHVLPPQRTTSPAQRTVSPDSTLSRENVPFSGADAAVMAAAFRSGLRQPGPPLSEEDGTGGGGSPRARSPERAGAEREALLRRELGDEGTDIRSVESARGVRVESSSEGHDLSRAL